MKKLLCLMLACALCAVVLSGCRRAALPDAEASGGQPEPDAPLATDVPNEGYHGEEDQSAALADMPTLAPPERIDGDAPADGDSTGEAGNDYYSIDALLAGVDAGDDPASAPEPAPQAEAQDGEAESKPHPTSAVDTSTYQYSALTDTSLGFTFNYPSHWENLPGVYTVCFREKVEPGDFPARVAITAKKLVHSPDETVINEQLTSYMRQVHKQYEAATFQAGTPNAEETFLGKPAYSNTYLAYSGENEVKGFIIGTAVGRTMYVFHFCATYEDYGAMESMMRYMVKSTELVDRE